MSARQLAPAVPPPPRWLSPPARAAWRVAAPKLAGVLWPVDRRSAFAALVELWVTYQDARRQYEQAPRGERRAWGEIRDRAHRLCRRYAAQFLVIPEDRVDLMPLDATGDDGDLRRLFTPGAPLRPIVLSPAARRNLAAWSRRAGAPR